MNARGRTGSHVGVGVNGIGIDLGTANTVVCHATQGLLLDEPSLMVIRNGASRRAKPAALGREARQMLGRTPPGYTMIRPLHDGVITDLESARAFITAIMHQTNRHFWQRIRPRAVIGVPLGASPLERRALLEAADEAHIRKAILIGEPIAGALGCGLDPLDQRVHLVVDVGGGTAEVTAFSGGGVVDRRSCRVAGDEMTLATHHYLREQHQLLVGELVAEDVKIRASTEPGPSIIVEGRDAGTGRPRLVTVSVSELSDAVKPVTAAIIATLSECLDDLPPQSVGDILAEGILLIGGGSLVPGFDQALEEAFGFSVKRADQPLTCVASGAARCLLDPAVLDAYAIG
jgi:rod shape-determining protein MreB and related proteins